MIRSILKTVGGLFSRGALPAIAALSALCATAFADAPKHKLLLLDESRPQILYLDQTNPANDWQTKIEGSHAWGFQLIGGDRLLCSMKEQGGFREYDLKTRKVVVEVRDKKRYGTTSGAVRFPDGRTVISCAQKDTGRFFLFDAQNKEIATWTLRELSGVRQIRRTARDTLLCGGSKQFVYEVSLDGKILRSVKIPDANQIYQATELPNGNLIVSAGYAGFLAEVTWEGKVVRHWGRFAKNPPPAGAVLYFMSQFQLLKNGNIVVATWTGHGANDSKKEQQVIEFAPDGSVAWKWHDPVRAGSIHGVYVMDDLDTAKFHDDVVDAKR